ncbi:MAG: hypothetical protein II381_11850, partial [Victivallales bacterium]|nr:hypothetical protein [Victivallales bacterium]
VPDIQEKATGFFRVQKLADGRWWAIDPLGRGFVAFGVDHCTYYGHYCEALDKHIHKELNDKKFKSREEWAEKTSVVEGVGLQSADCGRFAGNQA